MQGAIGRLLLAARKGRGPCLRRWKRTGWSNKESAALRELLNATPADRPAVALKRKGAFFARTLLIADIEYRAWTRDRKLRHPSFKSAREMERCSEIYESNALNEPRARQEG
ncbi:hypothetical protein N185_30525 [Sinorhizobium sp. GW3]|nr:hypothetical protein N185_30525 [Sinorhizobium sp. GW3]